MANENDVLEALELVHKNKPHLAFGEVSKVEAGYFAAIKYLYEKREGASSKDIAKELNVSSARIAILIKKLESKELICKNNDDLDARVVKISLSEKGIECAQKFKSEVFDFMNRVIDKIGFESFKDLIGKLSVINEVVQKNIVENEEE